MTDYWSGTITDRHIKILVLTMILLIPFFIIGMLTALSFVHLGYYTSEGVFGEYEDKMNDHLGLGLFWTITELITYIIFGVVAMAPPLIISLSVFKKDK